MTDTTVPRSRRGGDDTAERVCRVLGPVTVVRSTPLSGGLYNSADLVELQDGRRLVLKTAPEEGAPALAHERGLLGTEALFHRLAARAGVRVPAVLHHEPAGADTPAEWLLLTYLDGATWDASRAELTPADTAALRRRLGEALARVASVTGPVHGYPRPALGLCAPDWPGAFTAMLHAVLADADRFGVALPVPAGLLGGLPARFGHRLAEVDRPALVHFDAWPGNLVLDRTGAGPWRLNGLIDGERAFFGDPLAEFVGLDPLGSAEDDPDFLAGYRSVAPALSLDAGARIRLALYRVYLALVMRVESVPRSYEGEFASWLDTWSAERVTEQAALLDSLGE
ncbi:phosphotransferase family protein [Streptomyces roseolus]|uniref:phosphotransferase family protein n=1 Tax=Streptomyces roseolus TaxID=67358 RepID=UPI001671CA84|nr:phosphotransferase [Streptomyces roseolus]GGR56166.1 phosphotransferase [Streptomyces roseolus]